MARIEGSWSGMRKYLEREMLAPALRGRVRYKCAFYVGMDGCRVFEVFLDGRLFKQFSWETVNSCFIKMGLTQKPQPMSIQDYWRDFWPLLEKYPLSAREEYTDGEFCDAQKAYRTSDILVSLRSENPIVRMFALLDRRCGKRKLMRIKEEMDDAPEWLREIYRLRVKEAQRGQPVS